MGSFIVDHWKSWLPWKKHSRTIIHRSMRTRWGTSTSLDKGNQNSLVIKPIQLYVHHNRSLQLKSAIIDLASLDERGRDDIFGFSSLLGGSSNETLAGQLRYYRIVQKPPMNAWHNVGTYGKPAAPVDVLRNMRREATRLLPCREAH